MPSIKMSQSHNKPLDEVREIAEELMVKLKDSYSIDSNWTGDNSIKFKRTGLDGTLNISDSSVDVNLQLSFLLSSFKSAIESGVKEQLVKRLG